jgi:hypothetical protein
MIDRFDVGLYELHRLVDDLGDTRDALGDDDKRLALCVRPDKSP